MTGRVRYDLEHCLTFANSLLADARMTSKAVDKATNEGMRYLAKRKRSTIVEEDDDMSEHEVSVVLNHRKKQKVRYAGVDGDDKTKAGRRVTRSQSNTMYAGRVTRRKTIRGSR